jgi:energy-coupling factor transport system permease protein
LCIGVLNGTSLLGSGLHIGFAALAFSFARLPVRFAARNLRPFGYLAALVLLAHVAVNGLSAWLTGMAVGGRLLAMGVVVSLFSWTTQPLAIVAALRRIAAPLSRIGLPVDSAAAAIGLAMRFAPISLTEAETVIRAQAARGADFRGIRRKIALVVPLLGALFERSFARAEVLADAMDARGYEPSAPRTAFRKLGFSVADGYAAAMVILWLACAWWVERVVQ